MIDDKSTGRGDETATLEFVHLPPLHSPYQTILDSLRAFLKTRLHRFKGTALEEEYVRDRVEKLILIADKTKLIQSLFRSSEDTEHMSSSTHYMRDSLEMAIQALVGHTDFGEQAREAVLAYCTHVCGFKYYATASALTNSEVLRKAFVDTAGVEPSHVEDDIPCLKGWFYGRAIVELVILGIMNELLRDFGFKEIPHSALCKAAQKQGRMLANLQLRISMANKDDPSSTLLNAMRDAHLSQFVGLIKEGRFPDFVQWVNGMDEADLALFSELD